MKSTCLLGTCSDVHINLRNGLTGSQVFTWAPVSDWSRQMDGHVLISDWHQLPGGRLSEIWTNVKQFSAVAGLLTSCAQRNAAGFDAVVCLNGGDQRRRYRQKGCPE